MKFLKVLLVLLVLSLLPISFASAQIQTNDWIVYGGVAYGDSLNLSGGVTPSYSSKFRGFFTVDIGEKSSVSKDFALMGYFNKLHLGLLLGVNAEGIALFEENEPHPLTYFELATGFIAGYDFSDHLGWDKPLGISFSMKKLDDLNTDNLNKARWEYAGWLFIDI